MSKQNANNIEKLRNKLCLNGFKINFCSSSKKPSEYEYVSYDKTNSKENTQQQQVMDVNSKKCLKTPIKSNERYSNEYLTALEQATNGIKKQKSKFNLLHQFAELPQLQSTKMEQSTFNSTKNPVSYEDRHLPTNNIASTLIQQKSTTIFSFESDPTLSEIDENSLPTEPSKAFSNDDYSSPVLKNPRRQSRCCDFSDSSSSAGHSHSSESTRYSDCSIESAHFRDIPNFESTNINQEQLFVCCVEYNAKFDGDLSLKFSERVKLIHKNDDFFLVKNVTDGKCGYVPSYCITTVNEFLRDIVYLNKK